mmetsp:Transcript_5277/g.14155  ORF Transcript_5277/g.14155 Transcript_5277/m.14155 type:complete len:210 (+) Transcript_5277:161-790(+)
MRTVIRGHRVQFALRTILLQSGIEVGNVFSRHQRVVKGRNEKHRHLQRSQVFHDRPPNLGREWRAPLNHVTDREVARAEPCLRRKQPGVLSDVVPRVDFALRKLAQKHEPREHTEAPRKALRSKRKVYAAIQRDRTMNCRRANQSELSHHIRILSSKLVRKVAAQAVAHESDLVQTELCVPLLYGRQKVVQRVLWGAPFKFWLRAARPA